MSTRGWKQSRRRRTFPVTRSLITNRVTFCTVKREFFGKFDPVMLTFLECETMCRETPPEQVFVESMAEIDPRKVVEVVRPTRHIRSLQYTIIICIRLSPRPRLIADNQALLNLQNSGTIHVYILFGTVLFLLASESVGRLGPRVGDRLALSRFEETRAAR